MEITARRSAHLAALLLIVTVVTQIAYVVMSDAGIDFSRAFVWSTEAAAFLGISVFALVALARSNGHSAAWAAIAVGGTLNVVQVGMGLAMFAPLKEAGDAMAPAFQAVLGGAFFLYYAGKFSFGFAAIVIGMAALRGGSAAVKGFGGLAVLSGLVAMLINLGAMAGYELMFQAGAAGTAATLLLALAIIWASQSDAV